MLQHNKGYSVTSYIVFSTNKSIPNELYSSLHTHASLRHSKRAATAPPFHDTIQGSISFGFETISISSINDVLENSPKMEETSPGRDFAILSKF